MWVEDNVARLMVKERMEDAVRAAEETRALRLARPPRRSARVRLGVALTRLGQWLTAQDAAERAALRPEPPRGAAGML